MHTPLRLTPKEDHKEILDSTHGHETVVLTKPKKEHLDSFKMGMDTPAPLVIIKHVKVGAKFPKQPSGNTSPSICRNHIGGFYASA